MPSHEGHDQLPKKSFRIKQDDKFFSRLLSKEISQPSSSFRVYYGDQAAGAIPFVWESQPGTPKNSLFQNNSLPPLTPPPSYSITSNSTTKSMQLKVVSKPRVNLLRLTTIFFPRKNNNNNINANNNKARKLSQSSSSSLSPSSSSSSSSWSMSSFSNNSVQKRCRFPNSSNVNPSDHYGTTDYNDVDDHHHHHRPPRHGFPRLPLCFPVNRKFTYWRCVNSGLGDY